MTHDYHDQPHADVLARAQERERREATVEDWFRYPPTAPQIQCAIRQEESDYRVIGAVLAFCEKRLNHIAQGTFCRDWDGERRPFGKPAMRDAGKYAKVLALLRRAAFDEAERLDNKVKALNTH